VSPFDQPGRPLVVAHRGASAEAPENTVAAFRLAAERGADAVELDARLCGSGEVVCFHDDTLGRTLGVPGRIDETPLWRLRQLDAGGGERVPTLAEALAALPDSLRVHVEIKTDRLDDRGLAAQVAEVVRRSGKADRVGFVSFHPAALWRARRVLPACPLGFILHAGEGVFLRSGAPAPLLRCEAVSAEDRACTAVKVRAWHAAGLRVNVWTVDAESEVERFVRMGVDAITTNRPREARSVVDRLAH
jgi:glycerophosphoryl diester phosphodiesterase